MNPSATSDKNGIFKLDVIRARFSDEDLADIRFANSVAPLKNKDGAVISLNIVEGDTHLDLGNITVMK